MHFGLSDEQRQLQETVRRYLAGAGGLERIRRFAGQNQERDAELIAGLAELGVAGLLVPEAYGGAGLGMLEAALVAEMLGEAAAPVPFVSAFGMAPMAIARFGSADQQARLLPKIAAGEVIIGAALGERVGAREDAGVRLDGGRLSGRALFVTDFAADAYLVADDADRLHVVHADAVGLARQRRAVIDATRPTGELRFDGVASELLPGGGPHAVRALLDAGRVLLAADALGAAQSMLDKAVAYAKTREQFGRVIASFQAVKHMCAEMAASLEPCRAMMWYAAHALDAGLEDASFTASLAKAHLSEVATQVARTATEVHGGMGFTDLVGLHYWFKRIGADRQALGGPQQLREDAARLAGLEG